MKEFAFLNEEFKELILGDEIEILNSKNNENYLISNSKKINSQIYAPEINFYLKNWNTSVLKKAQDISILYEARAICFDLAKDLDFQKEVGKNVILVANRPNLIKKLQDFDFKVINLEKNEIEFVYGQIGEIYVDIVKNNENLEVMSDFFLCENGEKFMFKQSGCYEILNLNDDEIVEILLQNSPIYKYKNNISYDSKLCQYHERRSEHCAKCADICPTVAILKDDENKHLIFSEIDCIGCGSCVGVCPSSAITYAKMPYEAFLKIVKLYENRNILIIQNLENFKFTNLKLPENMLILALQTENILDEAYLLTALQETGCNIIYFNNEIGDILKQSSDIINQIYKIKFNKTAIFLTTNENELNNAINEACQIKNSKFSLLNLNLSKREIFSKRLSWLVGDEKLGIVKTDELVRYGEISINENSCTLCLSCVGACNTGALFADNSDNSIKYNASICTTCGYCVASCAEKDTIKLKTGEIKLQKDYFSYKILVKDELFKCIECGKEFAPSKAVMRVANIMSDKISDPLMQKTLYCCANCKAKLMIQQMHDKKDI